MYKQLEPLYETLGISIRELREECCLTQQQLADACHLTRTSIANIEAGKQRIMLHTLFDMCDTLNTNMIDIIMYPKHKTKNNSAVTKWKERALIAEKRINLIRKIINSKLTSK